MQLCDVQTLLVRLSRSFRAHRTSHARLPPPLHGPSLPTPPRNLHVLPPLSRPGSSRALFSPSLSFNFHPRLPPPHPLPLRQILQFIAKLSLLEHGLVVQCSQVDSIKILVPEKAPKGTAGKAVNATLSDQEEGESTDEPGETVEAYEKRLRGWVGLMIKKFGKGAGRDEYKKSGIVYDMRKSVIAQFLKSLNKKRCGRCGA